MSTPLLLLFLLTVVAENGEKTSQKKSDAEVFRTLFKQKRVEQLEAVKQLLAFKDAEKQSRLLDAMLQKMKDVLKHSRAQLEASGLADFVPDNFPENEVTRTSLARVMENTCLLSDILLHLPDKVHAVFAADRDFEVSYKWCLGFAESSGLVTDEPATAKLLDLAAQEVGVRKKSPDYINPYKVAKVKQKRFEDLPKKKDKKEKKKLQKGPRFSKSEL